MGDGDKKIVLIDCESPSVHGLRWFELLERIANLYSVEKKSSLKILPFGQYTALNAADLFKSDMQKIFASKKAAPTLLVLDEIERISPLTGASVHWREAEDFVFFWQSIRSFIQEIPGILNFLIVGTNPNSVEQPRFLSHDNPLFGLVPPLYVPCFDYGQTREMIETLGAYMGLNFHPSVLTKIQENFGGHPFLTRQVCSHIHKKIIMDRPVTVDMSVYTEAYESFIKDGAAYLAMMLDVLKNQYSDEYELLIFLAQGRTSDYESLKDVLIVNHLDGYGLVDRQLLGPVISVSAIKEYLLAVHRYDAEVDSDEKRREEIGARSNTLEIGLRALIRRSLRTVNSESKALEKVLASLPSERRAKLAGLSYRDLLADEDCPLFLLDLKIIIDQSWDAAFKNSFPVDKNRLMVYLDDLNEARRIPAHAKKISKEEFAAWRAAITRFEKWLSDLQ